MRKRPTMLLIFCGVIFINLIRAIRWLLAYFEIGRIPTFRDGIEYPPQIIFSQHTDEMLLLAGHFFNPILLLFVVVISTYICFKGKWEDWRLLAIWLVLFTFEIGIRFTDSFEYITFD